MIEDTIIIRNQNNVMMISTDFIGTYHPDEDVEQVVKEILVNRKSGKICFDINSEGLPYTRLHFVDRVVKVLVERGINTDDLFIMSGGSKCPDNFDYYTQHCQRFGWIQLRILFVEMFQTHAKDKIYRNLELYDNNQRTIDIKPKKFLTFNRTPKHHRVGFVAELLRRNLVDNAYVSSYINGTAEQGCDFGSFRVHHEGLARKFPKYYTQIKETLDQNEDVFPLTLTLDKNKDDHDISEELYLFNESYFGISTETKFFHDNYQSEVELLEDLSLDCNFFTEKTWKFVTAKQPFMVLGFTNSLARLRELGYKTFHPYIDESYDLIEDDEERLMAIVDEIERLCNQSDEEWLEFQKHTNIIAEYNFNVLKDVR